VIACRHCGTVLPSGALFCGVCGRSTAAPPPGERTSPRPRFIPGAPLPRVVESARPDDVTRPADPAEAAAGAPGIAPAAGDTGVIAPLDVPDDEDGGREDGGRAETGEPTAGEDPGWAGDDPDAPSPVAPARPSAPAPPILPVPSTTPPATGRPRAADAASAPESPAPVWVLQFSTGESVLVTGTGLIGRNPAAEPGEYVDHLVTLFDAGRSVSKTHLEFGQQEGRFWVSDRFSTNGSVIRPPDEQPQRCAPGRRYLVPRGTRIDIGEQFFVVS
jgi:hypothetical protein